MAFKPVRSHAFAFQDCNFTVNAKLEYPDDQRAHRTSLIQDGQQSAICTELDGAFWKNSDDLPNQKRMNLLQEPFYGNTLKLILIKNFLLLGLA